MEIIGKIFAGICFAIAVIFISAIVLIIALRLEIKLILKRRKYLREQLTKEEARLFEISGLINKFTETVNSYILEVVKKRQLLSDKTEHCKCLSPNNLQHRTSSQQIIPSDNQN